MVYRSYSFKKYSQVSVDFRPFVLSLSFDCKLLEIREHVLTDSFLLPNSVWSIVGVQKKENKTGRNLLAVQKKKWMSILY